MSACWGTSQVLLTQAEPLEGGRFVASGRLWVSPQAETDPRAVSMQGTGSDLPLDALARRYLPPVSLLASPTAATSRSGHAQAGRDFVLQLRLS